MNLYEAERNQLGTNTRHDFFTYASTAPAVAPAILASRFAKVNYEKESLTGGHENAFTMSVKSSPS